MQSGGLLGCKPKNFTGLFDYLKWKHNVGAREVISILDNFPEFALQNRQELIQKKIKLIKKSNPNLSPIFIRNLFRRHPDMFLKSYASMEAKVNYLKRNLNRQLQKEPAFPLLLHYNFTKHIWPRCEVLRDFGVKNFDLV